MCYCKAVRVLNQRINYLYFVLYNPNNQNSNYRNSLCYVCHQLNQIFTNYYNSSVLRSPADSEITMCTPLFQRKSQVELKCKLAIRRSDNNYSLNGLFSKLKSVFTHAWFLKGYKSFTPSPNKHLNTVKSSLKINKVNTATLIYSWWQSSMSYSIKVNVKIALGP